uniref:Uncharacterized protein n=1 Tax=Glossina austeni TaxID=7395 RepID=A0A1A9USK7_GLOAU
MYTFMLSKLSKHLCASEGLVKHWRKKVCIHTILLRSIYAFADPVDNRYDENMCTYMRIVVDVIVLYSVFVFLAIYVELLKIIFVFLRLQIEANTPYKIYGVKPA